MNYCNCPNCQTVNCPNATTKPDAECGSPQRMVRRLGWIGKQLRFNTATGHRWSVWVITLSNGRKLCECETESAAKRIYAALESANDLAHTQKGRERGPKNTEN